MRQHTQYLTNTFITYNDTDTDIGTNNDANDDVNAVTDTNTPGVGGALCTPAGGTPGLTPG